MLHILMGRAKTGKSDTVLHRIADLGDSGQQILLVIKHSMLIVLILIIRLCLILKYYRIPRTLGKLHLGHLLILMVI